MWFCSFDALKISLGGGLVFNITGEGQLCVQLNAEREPGAFVSATSKPIVAVAPDSVAAARVI